jgi:16S rRNA processing protein RimM
MRKKDCFYLGNIVKKHSFKGEVVIKLDTDEPELYKNMESVFVDLGGNLVPFFIKKSSLSRSTMLRVHFEDVNSEEEADFIMKAGIYLPLNLLPKLEGNQFYFHEIIGFHVIDEIHGDVGVLVYINDKAAQPMFEIENGDVEIFIPMIDDFIKKIDRENKQIHVKTPEGLFDLYLN